MGGLIVIENLNMHISNFFTKNNHFLELEKKGSDIYKKVRCGILHQGETTGGWKITREGKELFNTGSNTLNAVLFSERMKKSLNSYREDLLRAEWEAEVWVNFRAKMEVIIKNCQ